jgi:hypothetical protein
MRETANIRQERIERLLHELRYEVERGMMEREIDETMGFQFVVPISRAIPNGIVLCEFRTRPVPSYYAPYEEPRLRLVKDSSAA